MLPTKPADAIRQIRANYEWMTHTHLLWQHVLATRRTDLIPHIASAICHPTTPVLITAIVMKRTPELQALVDVLRAPNHAAIRHCVSTNNQDAFGILIKYGHTPTPSERLELVSIAAAKQIRWAFDRFATAETATASILVSCLNAPDWSYTTKFVNARVPMIEVVAHVVQHRNYPMTVKLHMCLMLQPERYATELVILQTHIAQRRMDSIQTTFRLANVHLEFHR